MGSNGYEIRLTILQMARDMLYENWHAAQNAVLHNAQLASEPVMPAAPPSFDEIETMAGKLYGFVQKNAAAPASTFAKPTHPCRRCSEE